MKNTAGSPSDKIKEFINFVENAESEYNRNLEDMKREDLITQDYLHKLELENLTCQERNKIATQLMKNRRKRRQYKDAVEALEPIVNFFDNQQNRNFINNLTQLLGKVRKTENYHQTRVYAPKVIPGEIIRKEIEPYVMSERL